jgi:hypothetical protein
MDLYCFRVFYVSSQEIYAEMKNIATYIWLRTLRSLLEWSYLVCSNGCSMMRRWIVHYLRRIVLCDVTSKCTSFSLNTFPLTWFGESILVVLQNWANGPYIRIDEQIMEGMKGFASWIESADVAGSLQKLASKLSAAVEKRVRCTTSCLFMTHVCLH